MRTDIASNSFLHVQHRYRRECTSILIPLPPLGNASLPPKGNNFDHRIIMLAELCPYPKSSHNFENKQNGMFYLVCVTE